MERNFEVGEVGGMGVMLLGLLLGLDWVFIVYDNINIDNR